VLILMAAAFGFWQARTHVAQWFAVRTLEAQGFGPVGLTVERLDLSGLRVVNISLGASDGLRAAQVVLEFTPGGLVEGRAEQLTINGLQLCMEIGEAGLVVCGLPPLFPSDPDEPGRPILSGVPVRDISINDLSVAAETPYGPISFTGGGTISSEPPNVLGADLGISVADAAGTAFDSGQIAIRLRQSQLDVDADLAWPGGRVGLLVNAAMPDMQQLRALDLTDPLVWLGAIPFEGELEMAIQDLAVRDVASAQRISGSVHFAAMDNTLRLEAPSGLWIDGLLPGPLGLSRMPEALHGPIAAGVDLTLGDPGQAAPKVSLSVEPPGLSVSSTTTFSLKADASRIAGDIDGRVTLGPDLAPDALNIEQLTLQLAELQTNGWAIDGEARLTEFAGTLDSAGGDLNIRATAAGRPSDRISFARVGLDLAGRVGLDAEIARFGQVAGEVQLLKLALGDGITIPQPVNIDLQGQASWAELNTATGAERHSVTLAPFAFDIALPRADDTDITARLSAATVLAQGSFPDTEKLRINGGRVLLPAYGLSAEHVAGDIGWEAELYAAELTVARLMHTAEPAYFAPVGARLEGKLSNEKAAFVISVFDPLGDINLAATGQHDVGAGSGAAKFTLDPLQFAPGVLDLSDLFPVARGRFDKVTGRAAIEGRMAWSENGLEPDVLINLKDVSGTAAGVDLTALNSRLRIIALDPLTTPPGQLLHLVVTGPRAQQVPVDAAFQLRTDGILAIEGASATAMGGELTTANALFDAAKRKGAMDLEMASVSLAELMAILGIEGLSGTGQLSGVMPLSLADGKLAVTGGALKAEGPGVVRYTSAKVDQILGDRQDTVGLAARALADFHYEELSLGLEKEYSGEGSVRIYLKGANPAVLEGYPFVFNINLESNFDRLAELLRQGIDIADTALQLGAEGLVE
jgi:hypothetical protein